MTNEDGEINENEVGNRGNSEREIRHDADSVDLSDDKFDLTNRILYTISLLGRNATFTNICDKLKKPKTGYMHRKFKKLEKEKYITHEAGACPRFMKLTFKGKDILKQLQGTEGTEVGNRATYRYEGATEEKLHLVDRAHNIMLTCEIIKCPDHERFKHMGFELRTESGYDAYFRYDRYITIRVHPKHKTLILYIHEIYGETAEEVQAIVSELLKNTVLDLEREYKGLMISKVCKAKFKPKKQHHAIPKDPVAMKLIEGNVNCRTDKFEIDASKGPELEFTDPDTSPDDHQDWVDAINFMAWGSYDRAVQLVDDVIEGRFDPRGIVHDVADLKQSVWGIDKLAEKMDLMANYQAELVEKYATTFMGTIGEMQYLEAISNRVAKLEQSGTAPRQKEQVSDVPWDDYLKWKKKWHE